MDQKENKRERNVSPLSARDYVSVIKANFAFGVVKISPVKESLALSPSIDP